MPKLKQGKKLIISLLCILFVALVSFSSVFIYVSNNKSQPSVTPEAATEDQLRSQAGEMGEFADVNDSSYRWNSSFKISSINSLNNFAENVSNGCTFKGKYVFLIKNLDMSEYVSKYADDMASSLFRPIGSRLRQSLSSPYGSLGSSTADVPFEGTFDGMGHEISNLTIAKATTHSSDITFSVHSLGLFSIIGYYGTVKNLKIDGVTATVPYHNHSASSEKDCEAMLIDYEYGRYIPYAYIGAIAGSAFPGATIEVCMVEDFTVNGSGNSCWPMATVGGIVGDASGQVFINRYYTLDEYGSQTELDREFWGQTKYKSFYHYIACEKSQYLTIKNCHVKNVRLSDIGTISDSYSSVYNGKSTVLKFGAITTLYEYYLEGENPYNYLYIAKCLVQNCGTTDYVKHFYWKNGNLNIENYESENEVFANSYSSGKYVGIYSDEHWDYNTIWYYEEEYCTENNNNYSMLRLFKIYILKFKTEDADKGLLRGRGEENIDYTNTVTIELSGYEFLNFNFDFDMGSQDFTGDYSTDIYVQVNRGYEFVNWTFDENTNYYIAHFKLGPIDVVFKPIQINHNGTTHYFCAMRSSTGDNKNVKEEYRFTLEEDMDVVQLNYTSGVSQLLSAIFKPQGSTDGGLMGAYWFYKTEGNPDIDIWKLYTLERLEINGVDAVEKGLVNGSYYTIEQLASSLGVEIGLFSKNGIIIKPVFTIKSYKVEFK